MKGNRWILRVDENHWMLRCRLCGRRTGGVGGKFKRSFKTEAEARNYWPEHVKSVQHRYHFTADAAKNRERLAHEESILSEIFGRKKDGNHE